MEKNEILSRLLALKRGESCDVAVMYSGGKDSAYLLYLLKYVYHLRVTAVLVDNGYEQESIWNRVGSFPEKLGIPLEVLRPDKEDFRLMFHALIVETEKFRKQGTNHVCFACNNILWCCAVKYAKVRGIPYVASGLSLEQLSSGRAYPLEPNSIANRIAEKSTKMIYKNLLDNMRSTTAYSKYGRLAEFIEQFALDSSVVTTVYPYIYHNEAVDSLKDMLTGLGWIPPDEVPVKEYISSGCKIMGKVIGELEKLGLLELNEREQARTMLEKGLIGGSAMEYAYALHDASKDPVDLRDEIMDELEIREFLQQEAIRQNKLIV